MRIRTIKPAFWVNEKMAALPDFARLLAIGLLNYADDHGFFWANSKMVRGMIFPFEEDHEKVAKGLAQLAAEGFVLLGKSTDGRDVGYVVNFKKHQRVDKPQASEIEPIATFQERSEIIPELIEDDSALYRKGKEGMGKEHTEGDSAAPLPVSVSKNFTPPTPAEVNEYSREIGYPLNGQGWCDTYAQKGWMVGKNKMKDWRAAVRNWKTNRYQLGPNQPSTAIPHQPTIKFV